MSAVSFLLGSGRRRRTKRELDEYIRQGKESDTIILPVSLTKQFYPVVQVNNVTLQSCDFAGLFASSVL